MKHGTSDYLILDAKRYGARVKVFYTGPEVVPWPDVSECSYGYELTEYSRRFDTIDQAQGFLEMLLAISAHD